MDLLMVGLAVVLLVIVAVDVFMTVFNPAEYGGALTRQLNRLIWVVARKLSRTPDGRSRHRGLALAAPIMALVTVVVWILLLVAGFAFIYLPWIDSFMITPGTPRSPLAEAFYFSASTAATLGLGDLVPSSVPLRLLAPVETLAGLGLLTAVLQYIMAISQKAQEMATTSLDIAVHLEGEQLPEKVAQRVRETGDAAGWGDWCEGVSRSLLELWEAHTRYPILSYFHPPNLSEALPLQLGRLMRLRREVFRAPERGPLAQHPGVLALGRSVELYVIAVDRHFLPGEDYSGDIDAAYRRLLDHSGYAEDAADAERGEAVADVTEVPTEGEDGERKARE